jgi:adenine-specific DNA-methyltransferase
MRQQLELTWIGKNARPKLEPRILLGDPEKSYHAKHRVTSANFFDNRLPLLPPRPQLVAARPLGPVGHQQGMQRRNAGGGDLQAGGLHLRPQDAHYWQHGRSTENDFIYATTQSLTPEQLQALSDEVGEGSSLLVYCSAFRGRRESLPQSHSQGDSQDGLVPLRGHDDCSQKVENLPMASPPELVVTASAPASNVRKAARAVGAGQAGLFDGCGE